MVAAISIKSLNKTFSSGRRALQDIHIHIEAGVIAATIMPTTTFLPTSC